VSWHLSGSVEEFADAAGDFLRSRPVEHTVPLTLVDSVRRDGPHAYGSGDPLFGWYRAADGSVSGACLLTPPSPLALDTGAVDVVLFTDLANPTSNALYQRLGYRPVEDRAVVEFR
jgi:hypothetical protein